MKLISKTDYLVFRECPKNAWIRIHLPEIYFNSELTEFEKSIIETGNEVELIARGLFPDGQLVMGRDQTAWEQTEKLLANNTPTIFQALFVKDGFQAAVDVLKFNKATKKYSIYEIKAANSIDEKTHLHDLAFKTNLLKRHGLEVENIYLIHLNPEYVMNDRLDVSSLFTTEDVGTKVTELLEIMTGEMEKAKEYLSVDQEPSGPCCCIYKGRSNHCSTFKYSNPKVPDYGIHDIARIGSSKAKLAELAYMGLFDLNEIPERIKLSDIQRKQVDAHVLDRIHLDIPSIAAELSDLVFPLYFVDYETFPCAVPRYKGFSPYQQIPFQYSLYVLKSADKEPEHFDFIYTEPGDPSRSFAESLDRNIGKVGSVIVWSKKFECTINKQLAERIPEMKEVMDSLNTRTFDLMDIFSKQYYVHKDFKGSTSVKYVLPVLVPELSYSNLAIHEGGTAASSWNKIVSSLVKDDEKQKIFDDLRAYCKLDTYAMFAIWKHLRKLCTSSQELKIK